VAEYEITKLGAAQSQIDTAIQLFFNEIDPLSIHTLACAAHQIIHDILGSMKLKDPLYSPDFIENEDGKRRWLKLMNKEKNFLKHADMDPENAMLFDSEISKVFIVAACTGIKTINRTGACLSKNIRSFMLWILIHDKEWFNREWYESVMGETLCIELEDAAKISKLDFFYVMQTLLR